MGVGGGWGGGVGKALMLFDLCRSSVSVSFLKETNNFHIFINFFLLLLRKNPVILPYSYSNSFNI